jgi:hypothetical protein
MLQQTNDQSEADIVLIEKDGRYFLFQPDIGVIASAESIDGAYSKFSAARRAFWTEVAQAGLATGGQTAVAAPSRGVRAVAAPARLAQRGVAAELGLFVAKFVIVLVVIGVIASALGARVADNIATALSQVKAPKQLSFADVSHKAADIARDIQSLSKEERETLLRSLATISRELDPMLDAWRNPPPR